MVWIWHKYTQTYDPFSIPKKKSKYIIKPNTRNTHKKKDHHIMRDYKFFGLAESPCQG